MTKFRDCVANCGLMDLGFCGHPFAWTNKQFGRNFICKRLDRAFANGEWCNAFPNAKVYHLSASSSDHSPILLDTHDQNPRPRKPFRYEIAWSMHDPFLDLIKQTWPKATSDNHCFYFYKYHNTLCARAKKWKKFIMGNIDRQLETFSAKILDLHSQIGSHYSDDVFL